MKSWSALGSLAIAACVSIAFASGPVKATADVPAPAATADPSLQPPSGIVPTKAALAQVLALYDASSGSLPKGVTTSREVDTIAAYGETGTYTELDSGDDFIETTRLGPTTTASGTYDGKQWRQNENGYTRSVSGVHEEEARSDQALSRAIKGENLASVRLLGEVAAPEHAYIVEVNPSAGRHEWLFIDTATGRLFRREESRLGHRIVWTYDDFRTTDGLTTPWHQHLFDGFAGNDVDWRTSQLSYGGLIAPSELAIPPTRSPLHFPAGVTHVRLPARIENGSIIVRLSINGRGLDFKLDSGTSGIALDAGVADQLGLKRYGESTHAVAGTFEAANTIVPEMRIGDLTLNDVSISALPFNYQQDHDTKIVGLLGYDFLAGAVIKVDYYNGTVDAYDPGSFVPPTGTVYPLSLKLDDAVPVVSASLGETGGNDFIIDTGSTLVVLFQGFAQKHAAELPALSYTIANKTYYPLVTAEGVGGLFELQPATVKHFVAGASLDDFRVYDIVDSVADFQGEDQNGLIGYQFLRYFDVYFDYNDSLVLLQPNPHLAEYKQSM